MKIVCTCTIIVIKGLREDWCSQFCLALYKQGHHYYLRVMLLKDADQIANSEDPDQNEQSYLGLLCLAWPIYPKNAS